MIDVMGPVATAAAIQAPAFVDSADAQSSPAGPASCFRIGYFFASVLRDLSVTLEVSY